MNKKAFCVAMLFLCATVVWLGVNIYWMLRGMNSAFDLVIAVVCVVAGIVMVYNEYHKKKRRHLAEANRNRIP